MCESCVVNVTGDAGEGLFIKGMHLGTALPCELPWLALILNAGTEHAGAVLINLKPKPHSITKTYTNLFDSVPIDHLRGAVFTIPYSIWKIVTVVYFLIF